MVKDVDRKVVELFAFHLDFPTARTFVAEDCDKVALEGELFNSHDFKIGDYPVYGFAWKAYAKAYYVFYHQGDCGKSRKVQEPLAREVGIVL